MIEEEWDLGAVVRGCRPSSTRLNVWSPSPTTLAEGEEEEVEAGKGGSFSGFPDLLQRWDGFQELEELYKPFFFSKSQQKPLQQQRSPPASWLSPADDPSTAVVGFPQPHPPSRRAHRLPPQIPRSKRRYTLTVLLPICICFSFINQIKRANFDLKIGFLFQEEQAEEGGLSGAGRRDLR